MDIRRHAHTHIDHKYAHTPTGRQRQTQTHAVFASRISDFVTWRLLAVLISCFTVEYCYKGPLSRDSLNFELKERRLRRSCWPRSHFFQLSQSLSSGSHRSNYLLSVYLSDFVQVSACMCVCVRAYFRACVCVCTLVWLSDTVCPCLSLM